MARGIHVTKLAKRLFQQQRSSGMRLDNCAEDEKKKNPEFHHGVQAASSTLSLNPNQAH
jgi:hypothetical protein